MLAGSLGEKTTIRDAGADCAQTLRPAPGVVRVKPGISPFDLSELLHVEQHWRERPPNKENMTDLILRLRKDAADVPLGSFIIDDLLGRTSGAG